MILKIPFGAGGLGKGNGAAEGPQCILDELGLEAEEVPVDNFEIDKSHKTIESRVSKLKSGIILGGDHSVTYSCVKGFAKQHDEFALIVFDAHADVMEPFNPPTHEEYLRALADDVVKPENIFVIGLRNVDEKEVGYLKTSGINYFMVENSKDIDSILKEVPELPIYLSIDIDVLDEKEAPGTGYPEPNGFTKEQLLSAIEKIDFVVADLVEVNPGKDIDGLTVKVAAEIVKKLLINH